MTTLIPSALDAAARAYQSTFEPYNSDKSHVQAAVTKIILAYLENADAL